MKTSPSDATLLVGAYVYRLRIDHAAMTAWNDALGRKGFQKFSELPPDKMPPLKYLRVSLWAALRHHHPEIDITATGDLITAAGVVAVREAIERALALRTTGD